jgi:hypothetical protein
VDVVLSGTTIPFDLSDITVSFLNQPCTEISGTVQSFNCKFRTKNSLSTVPAGTGTFKIHIKQFGYIDASSMSFTKQLILNG